MQTVAITLLNGLGYGLLLFMLASGLTLVFGLMGVLNFAHAAFYMLGAYLGLQLTAWLGFWAALVVAPVLVGLLGAAIEQHGLRRARRGGHGAELLFTFGLGVLLVEAIQLCWGRAALPAQVPAALSGTAFKIGAIAFPAYRVFIMGVALLVLGALALLLARGHTGLLVRAALTHPQAVEALGHDVPALHTRLFGVGCGLAALAGVLASLVYVTDPTLAERLGPLLFVVVVVGGPGSLAGSFAASITLGLLQTAAAASPLQWGGFALARMAPLLPYLLMIIVLLLRPQGLFGRAVRT